MSSVQRDLYQFICREKMTGDWGSNRVARNKQLAGC